MRINLDSRLAMLSAGEPWTFALLRIGYGLTLVTHGVPKLLGLPHGTIKDPLGASTHLIETVMGLPFPAQIAMAITLLETFGGLLLAAGLLTRLLALAFAFEMIGICVALGPNYPWVDRGIEYPIILGLIGLSIATRGGGGFAIDRLFARPRTPQTA